MLIPNFVRTCIFKPEDLFVRARLSATPHFTNWHIGTGFALVGVDGLALLPNLSATFSSEFKNQTLCDWTVHTEPLGGLVSVWDYARYIPTQVWQSDLYYFTGRSINEFSQVALLILIFGCILFLFLDRDYRLG
jgi:hypothetical protein